MGCSRIRGGGMGMKIEERVRGVTTKRDYEKCRGKEEKNY